MHPNTARCFEVLCSSPAAYLPKTRYRLDAFLRVRARARESETRETVVRSLLATGAAVEDSCGRLVWDDYALHSRVPTNAAAPLAAKSAASGAAAQAATSTTAATTSSGAEFGSASFEDWNLSDDLLRGIYSYGFEQPTHVQEWSIPRIAAGRHVVAQAKSCTGKTAAFVVGIFARIDFVARQGLQALILTQGRELAQQIHKIVLALGDFLKVRCHCCIGGTSVREDINRLRDGQHVVVGVPGRVKDMIEKRHLKLDRVKVLVFDEADMLLSSVLVCQGIVGRVPRGAQKCFFATTWGQGHLSNGQLLASVSDFDRLLVREAKCLSREINHFYINVEKEEWKLDTLCDLYETFDHDTSVGVFQF